MFKPSLERRSIRLPEYNYDRGGLFFITICAHNHKCIFGRVQDFEMIPNVFGKLVTNQWELFRSEDVQILDFVLMPNHFHAIVELIDFPLQKLVREFKSTTTNIYIKGVKEKGWEKFDKRIWQRNYFEHIIRNENSFKKISDYIINNPAKWEEDKFYQAD